MKVRFDGPRYLCSDLVAVAWSNEFGRNRQSAANLEEIWANGASLQLEMPVRPKTRIQIHCGGADLVARVRSCEFGGIGYFLEVNFESGYAWSPASFAPRHLFDPRTLKQQAPPPLPRMIPAAADERTVCRRRHAASRPRPTRHTRSWEQRKGEVLKRISQ